MSRFDCYIDHPVLHADPFKNVSGFLRHMLEADVQSSLVDISLLEQLIKDLNEIEKLAVS
eukprot:CAMPEP_0168318950 /NCGR_PEP_ID=MMETSP0213-20121227/774_1 /TAXON_ID=151035 /ORGANISM="Euplotes harpa, Strain FSP1.4" /LENGTH=59 /DNA_ID=CAMNT_0008320095 /DNA_START=72 /DNA_END=251 /DNA_ORIENTATION=-